MNERLGQQFGNYRLERLIGRGGFAEVYLGQHVRLGTYAAIKILHTHLTESERDLFEHEARTIASLTHPHIVRVLDYTVQEGIPFLVMDYAPNGSLRQRHPRGQSVPVQQVIDYVKQVASALQYAHEQKHIHRDVKPENMLIGPRQEILLSDFGIAGMVHGTSSMRTQGAMGTIYYMAPEQIQEHPRPASDQYALGMVVYEWLTGNLPFQGSMTEVLAKQLMTVPPPLREKVPTLSPELEQVVSIALAKDYKQRFASMQAFATALEEANAAPVERFWSGPPSSPGINNAPIAPTIAARTENFGPLLAPTVNATPPQLYTPASTPNVPVQLPPMAPAPPPPPLLATPQPGPYGMIPAPPQVPPRAPVPRKKISRRGMIIGLGVAGVVVVAGGITTWQVLKIVNAPPTHIYRGHTDAVTTVAWSPKELKFVSGSADHTLQVWDTVANSTLYTTTKNTDVVEGVAWSPDGQRIVSCSKDTTIQAWNATDGTNPMVYGSSTEAINAVAWSPDGNAIASGSADKNVSIWDALYQNSIYNYPNHRGAVTTVAWSPNSKRIASGSADRTVQVWGATDGSNPFTYHGHSDKVTSVAWSPDGKRIASGSADQTVQVWDAVGGKNVYTYRGHSGPVTSVAWSRDGGRIASASRDGTVQVWNAADGGNAYTYTGHAGPVNSVFWSSNGKVASGGDDKTVQVWMPS